LLTKFISIPHSTFISLYRGRLEANAKWRPNKTSELITDDTEANIDED